MKSRPILFSAPMVSALLAGTKTQTRRTAKFTSGGHLKETGGHRRWHPDDPNAVLACPYGQPGDRLWVKETHRFPSKESPRVRVDYRADMSSWGIADSHNVATNEVIVDAKLFPGKANEYSKQHWRPSIFMPRWASRVTLEVTAVRVERLNAISEADAIAEGIESVEHTSVGITFWKNYEFPKPDNRIRAFGDSVKSYASLWRSINGPESWISNPYVWVISFRRVTP